MTPLLIGLGFILAFIFIEAIHIGRHLALSKRLTKRIVPFSRQEDGAERVLFIGDSTGYGTGASESQYSLMGRLAKDVPHLHIENYSRTGRKLLSAKHLLEEQVHQGAAFDLVIIMVGGMNIVHFTPLWRVAQLLRHIVALSKQCGRKVVLIAPYNCGLAPLYHEPLSTIYQHRLAETSRLYETIAREGGIYFVSLYHAGEDALSRGQHYAADRVHPNDDGYGLWYDELKPTLYQALGTA